MKHIKSEKMSVQWASFQNQKSYWPKRRKGQKQFRLLSRQILIELLKKKSLSNDDLTALVQMFKWRCTEECFLKYLDQLKLPSRVTVNIQRNYKRLPQILIGEGIMIKSCGFTAVGLAKIKKPTPTHRTHIHTLLKSVARSKSEGDILKAVANYEKYCIPEIREGIYSPWLHALKPNHCPLVNNAVRPILKAGCWRDSYSEAVHFYKRAAKILKQSDRIELDRFFCHICEDEKQATNPLNLLFDPFVDPDDEKEKQLYADELPPVASGKEGRRRLVSVSVIERDPHLRLACKQKYGTNCVVCNLNFGETYGKWADGFIHVHHLKPLSGNKNQVMTMVKDLRPVCPNCHAMLHSKHKLMTIDLLKKELKKAQRN